MSKCKRSCKVDVTSAVSDFLKMGTTESREIWIPFECGENIPPETLKVNSGDLFIGRTFLEERGLVMVSYNKTNWKATVIGDPTQEVDNFELLTGRGHFWVTSYDGRVPPNSVPGCVSSLGETLYVGRARINGKYVPGVVVGTEHGLMHGNGEKVQVYEVLTSITDDFRDSENQKLFLNHAGNIFKGSLSPFMRDLN